MTMSTDARRYAQIRYRLLLVDGLLTAVVLALLQFSGYSRAIAGWWSARHWPAEIVVAGYLLVFGLVSYFTLLPIHVYGSFYLEHRFGLSRLSVRGWLVREAKHIAVSGLLSVILIEGLYELLRHAPRHWPVWATIGWVLVSIVLARIFPTVLLPLFYKTAPLQDQALVRRLLNLCERTGLSALGVFRFELGADTRKANAALAGLGKTRRVLVSDTLVAEFTPEEIEGVLAHELGHQRYRHITKLLILSAIGSWIAFRLTDAAASRWVAPLGLQGLADMAGFPMLMLWFWLLGLLGLPLQNGVSRRFEWQADRFATTMIPSARAFADALRRLAQLNLADPNPPAWVVWLFYDHPPITARIQAAEKREP